MKNNNIINKLQLCSLLLITLVSPFLGMGIHNLIKKVGVDFYFSVIIGGIVGIIILLLYFYTNKYEPTLPINKKINTLFGNKIGFIVNLIICICLFIIGIFTLYNLVNFIVSQFLSETPLIVIGLLFSLIIIYVNIKGIETLSRTSLILTLICIVLFSIAILSLLQEFDISNLKPILEHGIKRPLEGSFYFITTISTPFFILLMIPKKNIIANSKQNKWITITYIIGIFFMFLTILFTIGCLGIHLASIYQYPEYIVLKRINLFNFLDRIENIIIIQWVFGSFITLSLIVYYISNNIKNNNKSKILPTIITAFILIASNTLFKNNTIFNELSYKYLPYVRLVVLIILIIISLLIFIKKKKPSN